MPKFGLGKSNPTPDQQFQSFDDDDSQGSFDRASLLRGAETESMVSGSGTEKRPKSPLKRLKNYASKRMDRKRGEDETSELGDSASVAGSDAHPGSERPSSPVGSMYSDSVSSAQGGTRKEMRKPKPKRRNMLNPLKSRGAEVAAPRPPPQPQMQKEPDPIPANMASQPPQPAKTRRRPSLLGALSMPMSNRDESRAKSRDESRSKPNEANVPSRANPTPIRRTQSHAQENQNMLQYVQNADSNKNGQHPPSPQASEKGGVRVSSPTRSTRSGVSGVSSPSRKSSANAPKGKKKPAMPRRASFRGFLGGGKAKKEEEAPKQQEEAKEAPPPKQKIKRRSSLNAAAPDMGYDTTMDMGYGEEPAPKPRSKTAFARRSSLSAAAEQLTNDDDDGEMPVSPPRQRFTRRNSLDNAGLAKERGSKSSMRPRSSSPTKLQKAKGPPPQQQQQQQQHDDVKIVKLRKKATRRLSMDGMTNSKMVEPVDDLHSERMSETGRQLEDTRSETSKSSRRVTRAPTAQGGNGTGAGLRRGQSLRGFMDKKPRPAGRSDEMSVGSRRNRNRQQRPPTSAQANRSDLGQIDEGLTSEFRPGSGPVMTAEQKVMALLGKVDKPPTGKPVSSSKPKKKVSEVRQAALGDTDHSNYSTYSSYSQSSPTSGRKKGYVESLKEEQSTADILFKSSSPLRSRTKGFVQQLKREQSQSKLSKADGEQSSSKLSYNGEQSLSKISKADAASPTSVDEFDAGVAPAPVRRKKKPERTQSSSDAMKPRPPVELPPKPEEPTSQPTQLEDEQSQSVLDEESEPQVEIQGFAQLSFAPGADGQGVLDVQYEQMA